MQSAMASMSNSVGAACSGGGGAVESATEAVESYCGGNGFAVNGGTGSSAQSTGTAKGGGGVLTSSVFPGTF
jgi:hypothetical protein